MEQLTLFTVTEGGGVGLGGFYALFKLNLQEISFQIP
jgi:hypothetical protein